MKEDILKFISRFTSGWTKDAVEECFIYGCCFWFAHIMVSRFPQGLLAYDQVANHFGCLIDGIVYDVTGDVTDQYKWEAWATTSMTDPALAQRIERDCIYF